MPMAMTVVSSAIGDILALTSILLLILRTFSSSISPQGKDLPYITISGSLNLAKYADYQSFHPTSISISRASADRSYLQQKPQAWRQQILQGPQKLGQNWKGSYGMMTSMIEVRSIWR